MSTRIQNLWRGIELCYATIQTDADTRLTAHLAAGDVHVDVPVWPLGEGVSAFAFPHLRESPQALTVREAATGNVLAHRRLSYTALTWSSRLAYRTSGDVAGQVKRLMEVKRLGGATIEVLGVFPLDDTADVVRIAFDVPGGATVDGKLACQSGGPGVRLLAVLEDVVGDTGTRQTVLAYRVPKEAGMLVFGLPAWESGCTPGFLCLTRDERERLARERRHLMGLDGVVDDYPAWQVRQLAHAADASLTEDQDAYVLLNHPSDLLEPDAFAVLQAYLETHPGAQAVYCDDDEVDPLTGEYCHPRIKPALNPDLLYANNYVGDCLLVRRELLKRFDQSSPTLAYDICLGLSAEPGAVAHVERVLCHRRHAAAPIDAEADAVRRALEERGLPAQVEPQGSYTHVTYARDPQQPLVSVVIPTKDHVELVQACVDSLLARAGYENLEVVLIENNSTDPATFAWYEKAQAHDPRIRVVTYQGGFNYSAIINFGVAQTRGELLLLLNNDTEAISPGLVATMAGYFCRPEVGVVGAQLLYHDGLVQHAGIALMPWGGLSFMNHDMAPGHADGYLGSLACPYDYPAVIGACQMVRRATFEQLGGYDEDLAVTYNDVDFCLRVRELGQLCVYTPYAQMYHQEFATRGRDENRPERFVQTQREAGLMRLKWPELFATTDPTLSSCYDPTSLYFRLG